MELDYLRPVTGDETTTCDYLDLTTDDTESASDTLPTVTIAVCEHHYPIHRLVLRVSRLRFALSFRSQTVRYLHVFTVHIPLLDQTSYES